MSQYSIKDLEQLSGIKAHTLRIWETRYAVLQPKRTPTNIRFYDDVDLKTVLNISVLNEHGYKISKIARMTPSQISEEVVRLSREFCHYPDQIQSLTMAMIDLDEPRFDKVMTTNIARVGLERTMVDIVYPFLTRIGVLWQTGAINPAQEHFITNLIRQKLMVAIDEQSLNLTEASRTFVLFLPESELHEIGLLFANWLIKRSNHRTFYLGQSTPLGDLLSVCKVIEPDYVLGLYSGIAGDEQTEEYITTLATYYQPAQLLFSGYYLLKPRPEATIPFTYLPSVNDLTILLMQIDKQIFHSHQDNVLSENGLKKLRQTGKAAA